MVAISDYGLGVEYPGGTTCPGGIGVVKELNIWFGTRHRKQRSRIHNTAAMKNTMTNPNATPEVIPNDFRKFSTLMTPPLC
jgi:hypothetical protein